MGTLMGSGALMLWLDVAPELDRETDGWYIDEHMPERIDIGGYLRARRFSAMEGTPAYLTLFEAKTPAALASEGYLHLVGRISKQSQRIRAGFSNVVRNTFEVRQSVGRGIGTIVASLRLAASERADLAANALDLQVPQLLRRHGVVGVHWLQAAAGRARTNGRSAGGRSVRRECRLRIVDRSDTCGRLAGDSSRKPIGAHTHTNGLGSAGLRHLQPSV